MCQPSSGYLQEEHFYQRADDVNILGGSIHTQKENAEALVAATR